MIMLYICVSFNGRGIICSQDIWLYVVYSGTPSYDHPINTILLWLLLSTWKSSNSVLFLPDQPRLYGHFMAQQGSTVS